MHAKQRILIGFRIKISVRARPSMKLFFSSTILPENAFANPLPLDVYSRAAADRH